MTERNNTQRRSGGVFNKVSLVVSVILAVSIGIIYIALERFSGAATPFTSFEAESSSLSGQAVVSADSRASQGSLIEFRGTTSSGGTYPVRVTADNRYFVTSDNKPFLYVADTVWLGSVKLTQSEWSYVLEKRKSQGFNTIQVSIPGFWRASSGQFDATLGYTNRYGDEPFNSLNLASPKEVGVRTHNPSSADYDFWDHIDWMIDAAAARDMQLNLTAAWYGYGGEDWRPYVTNTNATTYGNFLGQRLGHKKNIMWTMGGDNNPNDDTSKIPSNKDRSDKTQATKNLANAIRSTESLPHLMSYHAKRRFSSNEFFASEPWHTMAYSYSAENTYVIVGEDYNRTSNIKPIVMPEAYYDDWQYGGVYLGDRRLRAQAYWTYLNGGVGFAYGHRSIWPVRDNWKSSLDANSAVDIQRLTTLFRDYNDNSMVPDHRKGNATKLLTSGYGSSTSLNYAVSARSSSGTYGLAYFPTTRNDITVNLASLGGGNVSLYWWNPASGGAKTSIGTYQGSGTRSLAWPAGYSDAVLVAEKR